MAEDVEIEVQVKAVSLSAIKVFDGKREAWLPKSQISDYTDGPEDGPGIGTTSVFIPEWLAIEKGLV
jgi:hypothetical protein